MSVTRRDYGLRRPQKNEASITPIVVKGMIVLGLLMMIVAIWLPVLR